jgi:UrcA family protein
MRPFLSRVFFIEISDAFQRLFKTLEQPAINLHHVELINHSINWENIMKILISLVAASSVALSLASVAQADTAGVGRTVKVQFDGNDVNKDPAPLYRRIKQAAARVCSQFDSTRSLAMQGILAHCMQLAIDDAVVQVDRPVFTAYAQTQQVESKGVRLASR